MVWPEYRRFVLLVLQTAILVGFVEENPTSGLIPGTDDVSGRTFPHDGRTSEVIAPTYYVHTPASNVRTET